MPRVAIRVRECLGHQRFLMLCRVSLPSQPGLHRLLGWYIHPHAKRKGVQEETKSATSEQLKIRLADCLCVKILLIFVNGKQNGKVSKLQRRSKTTAPIQDCSMLTSVVCGVCSVLSVMWCVFFVVFLVWCVVCGAWCVVRVVCVVCVDKRFDSSKIKTMCRSSQNLVAFTSPAKAAVTSTPMGLRIRPSS